MALLFTCMVSFAPATIVLANLVVITGTNISIVAPITLCYKQAQSCLKIDENDQRKEHSYQKERERK